MKTFKQFFITEQILLEAKVDDYVTHWTKQFVNPLWLANPIFTDDSLDPMRKTIRYAHPFGQSAAEHRHVISGLLHNEDGEGYVPYEDEEAITDNLGNFRRAVTMGLAKPEDISKHNTISLAKFFEDNPQVIKPKKIQDASKDLAPYHIGKVYHPDYGSLDVYHIQQDNVKNTKEYSHFSKALKKSCPPGSTICVQHNPEDLERYSNGHGFFAFMDSTGTLRAAHGHEDHGIVNHANVPLKGPIGKSLAKQVEPLIKNPDHLFVYKAETGSLNVTHDDITKAYNSPNEYVRKSAIGHQNVTVEHLTQAIRDPSRIVRLEATRQPNLTPKHIALVLLTKDEINKTQAISHPNASVENITKALTDRHAMVRVGAIKHPNATTEHIDKALTDSYFWVRAKAGTHQNATSDQITRAISDPDENVRYEVFLGPNTTAEHKELYKKIEESRAKQPSYKQKPQSPMP